MLHWDWTVDVVRRFLGKLAVAQRWNLVIDALLFAALIVCTLSGLMVSRYVLIVLGYFAWKPIHSISATVLLALTLVHLAMHWKWIAMAVKTRVVERVKGKAEKPQEELVG
ncbi:MAG: DUF4405 domain-containing protein [Coriobacteriia bacterium]